MKRFIVIISLVLLVTVNIILGFKVADMEKELSELKIERAPLTNEVMDVAKNAPEVKENIKVTTISSDISEVYDKVIDSVVTVLNLRDEKLLGHGSGFVYRSDTNESLIVTNHHVIGGGNNYKVVLSNNQELEATLVGSDPFADVAVLKVADGHLQPIKLGDSQAIKIGSTVLAIGSPSGPNFSGSLSVGVLSGKDRVMPVDIDNNGISDWDMVLLQTDAAINPGNSGGPLVNMQGELIGINTLKIVNSGVEGMGFASPVNEVEHMVSQIIEYGKVIRPFIGISAGPNVRYRQISRLLPYYQTQLEPGIVIEKIMPDSPADRAGLRAGDVILKFNEVDIDTFKTFRQQLYQCKPGDTIELTLQRDQREMIVKVHLQ